MLRTEGTEIISSESASELGRKRFPMGREVMGSRLVLYTETGKISFSVLMQCYPVL